jgi:serine/threonine-protein kinase
MRCPACQTEIPVQSRFCLKCGADLDPEATMSGRAPGKLPSSNISFHSSADGRFTVGSLIGERFRILGLLGRGGMGEVYRAHDIKLEQHVALKFLPQAAIVNRELLERFRAEVRIARNVSHRNVCRVYDLGEIGGAPFIAMEYVDGEDLASLLRRIGRLPGDKATEFARRLCAGLAAAHEKGVRHRDLKPANVMIDGRGEVRIMDFGLAAVSDAIAAEDIRSGTPAYMAPEQREGREVTVLSDIYALGLVFAEMFTGQRPSSDGALSGTVKDVDPAIEKVIQRCLDPNPSRRPASAFDVARALPGGDPLAEALAAGETPSPEMVAASDDTGALSVRVAALCFAAVLVGLAAAVVLGNLSNPIRKVPFRDSPEILARKAQDIAKSVGYTNPPVDSAFGFNQRPGSARYATDNLKLRDLEAFLIDPRTSSVVFWYRQSPRELVTLNPLNPVSANDPPQTRSEMFQVSEDAEGRLISFSAVPPQEIDSAPARAVDWAPLFQAAGLDPAEWKSVPPRWAPLASLDEMASWTGTFPHVPGVEMRIDAAAWKGRPVQFEIIGPWDLPARDRPRERRLNSRIADWLVASLEVITVLFAAFLAANHYRRGRGDPQSALCGAAFIFCCGILQWFLLAHHVAVLVYLDRLMTATGESLFRAALFWVLYMALEPYVRRRLPQSLISWTRLASGSFRDPIVAGHTLLGVAFGVGLGLLFIGLGVLGLRYGVFQSNLQTVLGPRYVLGNAFDVIAGLALVTPLGVLVFFVLLRGIFRKTWLTFTILTLLSSIVSALYVSPLMSLQVGLVNLVVTVSSMAVLVRFGVLPIVFAFFVSELLRTTPLTTDISAWYANSTITVLVVILVVASWSFHMALGGRQVWKTDFLEG